MGWANKKTTTRNNEKLAWAYRGGGLDPRGRGQMEKWSKKKEKKKGREKEVCSNIGSRRKK